MAQHTSKQSGPGASLTNADAEHAVVGALLIDPGFAAAHVKRLQPGDFTDPMARAVVRAYLDGGATDPIEVSTRAAEATGQSFERLLGYATEQMTAAPSAIEVETYVGLAWRPPSGAGSSTCSRERLRACTGESSPTRSRSGWRSSSRRVAGGGGPAHGGRDRRAL